MEHHLLLIDDEYKTIMSYFAMRLEERGFNVVGVSTLAEAVTWLEDPSESRTRLREKIDCVVLDVMFPLAREDKQVYAKLTGREPKGVADPVTAGAKLIGLIEKTLSGVPIYILTSLPEQTGNGRRLRSEVKDHVKKVQLKPADGRFIDGLWDAAEKHAASRRISE